jgi:replicative DNA helicase
LGVIDYVGLVRKFSDRQMNRNQEVGEICRQLKETAGELRVPFLVLSQLSRGREMRPDRRPIMSDLRDSEELENHADMIAFLHRPGCYNREDPALRTTAELIVSKQRNGDTGTIPSQFQREYGRFNSADPGDMRSGI